MSREVARQNITDCSLVEDVFLKYKSHFPIHDAAKFNDVEAVNLLSKRKDVNALNEEGLSPLIVASWYGHLKVVETLLELDADVNLNDKGTERTALHYASLAGHKDVIDILLKHGSVVHFRDKEGISPLHLAAEGGHPSIIDQLASVQGDLNGTDKNGARPIHYAAQHNQVDALYKLHDCGADVVALDNSGCSALHYAARSDSSEAIMALVRLGTDIDLQCKKGDTPLHSAVRADMKTAIKTLAECGAALDERNKEKECPIHIASRLGLALAMKILVKYGNDVSILHKHGKQCVHIAAEHGCCDVLKVLHGAKADLNAEDKHKDRPIHYAVKADSDVAIQKLAELKANLNAPGKKGYTALHLAAKEKKTNIVNLLGSLGADCNIENEIAVFPIYYAANNKDMLTTRCLIRHGAKLNKLNSDGQAMIHVMVDEEKLDGLTALSQIKANLNLCNEKGDTPIHLATKRERVEVLEHLKSIGADINAPNNCGLSALHETATNGNLKQMKILLKLGLDISCKSKDFNRGAEFPVKCGSRWPPKQIPKEDYWKIKIGLTPLQCAMLSNQQDIVQNLTKAYANINDSNEDGETVFHIAVWFSMTDWYKYLVTLGADRNARDRFGRVPLHYAAYTGNIESVRALLKYGASLDSTDEDGRLPLHYASEGGHFLLIPEFMTIKNANINCVDKRGRTPLHIAAQSGKGDMITELVQLGGDINFRDKDGNSPLHLAAGSGSNEIIVQLASIGADINVQNKDLRSPLHMAADKGQGEAMEFLLMCGCDPNLKDKGGLQPSFYKLSAAAKRSIAKRIKEYNAHNTSRHSTGEISCEAKKINSGKPVEFGKLSVTVSIESLVPVSPTIFLRRTPANADNMEIPLHGLEEVLSDKYELCVFTLTCACNLSVDVPMDGYPGEFESFLRTTDGKEFKEITTSEENGVPYLKAKIPISNGTMEAFAVVVRPVVHKHTVSNKGDTIVSDVDRRIRVEIPKGTFYEDTSLQMQVLKTDDTERRQGLLLSDVVNVKTDNDKTLHQSVTLRLPLHDKRQDPDAVIVFTIQNEDDIEDESKWSIVHARKSIQNESISFSVAHFSIYFTITNTVGPLQELKRQTKDQIKRAMQRETSVVFFYAAIPKKNCFLTIFECTTPGRFKRRSEYWLKEGFLLHPQVRHSGHFVASPNQKYRFTVTGNLQRVGSAKTDFSLTFNPRAYKYQSFYLTKVLANQPWIGEINVTTFGDPSIPNKNKDFFVTSVPVEIPKLSRCPIS